MWCSRFDVPCQLLRSQCAAMAVVAWWLAARNLLVVDLFQPLRRAEALVRMSAFHELLGVAMVDRQPLRLLIWREWSADIRSFIPIKAHQAQRFFELLLGPRHVAVT